MKKSEQHKIIVAITGASGAIYAHVLLQKLQHIYKNKEQDVAIIISENARQIWKEELKLDNYKKFPFSFFEPKDFYAPFASGSSTYKTMIVCPCSMGTLGRIASGVSDDLITRAADVVLKEQRKLILVVRESPYNLIHINNMKTLTEAGGIICPASPSFYSNPASFEELASTIVDRVLDIAGFSIDSFRWGKK